MHGRIHCDFQVHLKYVGFHGCSTVDRVSKSEKAFAKEKITQCFHAKQ